MMRPFKIGSPKHLWGALCVLAVSFIWNCVFMRFTPPFEGPDEIEQYCTVAIIAGQARLPTLAEDPALNYKRGHPPLYYLLGAPLIASLSPTCYTPPANPFAVFDQSTPMNDNRNAVAISHVERRSPDVVGLNILRLLSVMLGALTVALTYRVAHYLFADGWMAVAASVLVAGLPTVSWISAVANNDNLAMALGSLLTLYGLRLGRKSARRRDVILAGIAMGLAVLTKLNMILFGIPLAGALLLSPRAAGGRGSRAAPLALFTIVGIAVCGWWFVFNSLSAPDLTGLRQFQYLGPVRWVAPPSSMTLVSHLWNQWAGLLSWYGYQVRMPSLVSFVGLIFMGVGAVGLLIWLHSRPPAAELRTSAVLALFAVTDIIAGIAVVVASRDGGQARFLLPGVTSLACLMVLGFRTLVPSARRRWGAVGLITLVAIGAVSAFVLIYLPAYQPSALWAANEKLDRAAEVDADFQGIVKLLGAMVTPEHVAPDEGVVATICWKPLSNSYPVVIALSAWNTDEQKIAERNTFPGLGHYLSTDWILERPFCDAMQLSLSASQAPIGRYAVKVGIIDMIATLPDDSQTGWVTVGSFEVVPQ